MNAIIWAIAGLLIALALGVFLLGRKNIKKSESQTKRHQEEFEHELAREIAPHDSGSINESAETRDQVLNLPEKYERDRLVLMARDPYWLYAYWEISATKEDFSEQYGPAAWSDSQPVLRVYDVTGLEDFNGGNANSYVDIPLNADADNWHFEVGNPDRSYCVDLGRVLPGGRFVVLLRSNVAITPRATISDRLDEEWMWIEGVYRTFNRLQPGGSSPLIIEELRERMGTAPQGVSSPELVYRKGNDS